MRRKKNLQTNARFVVFRDILLLVVCLLVFAYFHHVKPSEGKLLGQTVDLSGINTNSSADKGSNAEQDQATNTEVPVYDAAANPTQEPEEWDFTTAFAQHTVDKTGIAYYEGSNVKISVKKVQENGVTYFVADVVVKTTLDFKTALAKDRFGRGIYENPLDTMKNNNGVFAVTGDYYGAREGGIVVRNGQLFRNTLGDDVCVLYLNGVMKTFEKGTFNINGADGMNVWQAWCFGPRLMENGVARTVFDDKIKNENPRCSIGYYSPGHYCFVVVDGRQEGYSRGMTLSELAAVYQSLGCVDAYNLDGGQTAQMMMHGQMVNQPYNGGRNCSDIIFFSEG